MAAKAKQRRAIGIVRVSRVGGREGESFTSPDEQRKRIESECEREGLELIDVISELDVSGGTPLSKREGLRTAIERVEAGEAQVIVNQIHVRHILMKTNELADDATVNDAVSKLTLLKG